MSPALRTVPEYIQRAPEWAKPTLRALRRVIRSAAPRATEAISYHMPYYAEEGRVAYFAVAREHCSFHWVSAEDKRAFAAPLAAVSVVGSTLRIPRGERVPAGVIRRIVQAHVRRNRASRR